MYLHLLCQCCSIYVVGGLVVVVVVVGVFSGVGGGGIFENFIFIILFHNKGEIEK